jgi:hypothetical protein
MQYDQLTHTIIWSIPEIIGYFLPILVIGIFLWNIVDDIKIIKDNLNTLILRDKKSDKSTDTDEDRPE